MKICSSLLVLLFTLMLCTSAGATTIFYDDFEDGNAADGSPIYWTGNRFVEEGSLVASDIDGLSWAHTVYHPMNISIQSRFRLIEGDYGGIAGRHDDKNYHVYIGTDPATGRMNAGVEIGGAPIQDLVDVTIDFDAHQEDVILQLDMFENQISFWAWPADESRPTSPLGSIIDSTVAQDGQVALWAFNGDGSICRGAFRYVHVSTTSIPEPSADFDSDADVDGADFLYWQLIAGSKSDLADWQEDFGDTSSPAEIAIIPEPSTLLLGALATAGLLVKRRTM
jgi:PEP-CTERM motif-containing protein